MLLASKRLLELITTLADEFFFGARIVPMAYNYAFNSKYPGPGLPALEADTSTTTFFVQPTLSLGFNFGKRNNEMVVKDTDGDGVADDIDYCPTVAGTVNGCS